MARFRFVSQDLAGDRAGADGGAADGGGADENITLSIHNNKPMLRGMRFLHAKLGRILETPRYEPSTQV